MFDFSKEDILLLILKSNLQNKPLRKPKVNLLFKVTTQVRSKLLILLSVQFVLLSSAFAELSAGCEIQLVRADVERLQYVPTGRQNKDINIMRQTENLLSGKEIYEIVSDRPGAKSYKVSLSLKIEENRSPWKSSNSRLTVMTKLLSSEGQVLAISEGHSDQLYTPKMLEWITVGQKPMLISKLHNPEILNLILKGGDEQLAGLAEVNLDQAVKMGIAQKIISPDMAYVVDTVCRIL